MTMVMNITYSNLYLSQLDNLEGISKRPFGDSSMQVEWIVRDKKRGSELEG